MRAKQSDGPCYSRKIEGELRVKQDSSHGANHFDLLESKSLCMLSFFGSSIHSFHLFHLKQNVTLKSL